MTTLVMPSLQRRLIKAVGEEMEAEPIQQWAEESRQFLVDLLRRIREHDVGVRHRLEAKVVDGVEAHSFVRDYGPLLAATDEQLAGLQPLMEKLPAEDSPALSHLGAELRSLIDEKRSFRAFLAEALARAAARPRPVDFERSRSAEAAYARGETKPFAPR